MESKANHFHRNYIERCFWVRLTSCDFTLTSGKDRAPDWEDSSLTMITSDHKAYGGQIKNIFPWFHRGNHLNDDHNSILWSYTE